MNHSFVLLKIHTKGPFLHVSWRNVLTLENFHFLIQQLPKNILLGTKYSYLYQCSPQSKFQKISKIWDNEKNVISFHPGMTQNLKWIYFWIYNTCKIWIISFFAEILYLWHPWGHGCGLKMIFNTFLNCHPDIAQNCTTQWFMVRSTVKYPILIDEIKKSQKTTAPQWKRDFHKNTIYHPQGAQKVISISVISLYWPATSIHYSRIPILSSGKCRKRLTLLHPSIFNHRSSRKCSQVFLDLLWFWPT